MTENDNMSGQNEFANFAATARILAGETKKTSLAKRIFPPILMILAFSGLLVLGWYAYQDSTEASTDPAKVPTIKADTTPFKVEADRSQNENIAPNINKKVYDVISSDHPSTEDSAKDNTQNKILAQNTVEEPMSHDAIKNDAQQNSESDQNAPAKKPDEQAQPSANTSATAPVNVAPVNGEAKTVNEAPVASVPNNPAETPAQKTDENTLKGAATEKAVEDDSSVNKKAAAETAKKTKKAEKKSKSSAAKAATAGKYKVQLGAFKSDEEAKTVWSKLSKSKSQVLAGQSPHIEKADLGSKGTFYRLQTGGFKNESEAKNFCRTVIDANKKQGCFVVQK